MLVTKHLMVAIDFYSMKKILWKSMATANALVTKILQIILFFVEQKNETE